MATSQAPFYMTLPSDVNMETYSNTAANWTTKLKKPVQLTGQWEVAVVELIYPNSLLNVPSEQVVKVDQLVDVTEDGAPSSETTVIRVPPGFYSKDDLTSFL